jgi:hypothetical protein
MSVPSIRGPQKIPVNQITRGLKCCAILVFMQGNYLQSSLLERRTRFFP